MYIIRASLSESHYMMSTVKSVFLLAWYITPYMEESHLSANHHYVKHMYMNGPLSVLQDIIMSVHSNANLIKLLTTTFELIKFYRKLSHAVHS